MPGFSRTDQARLAALVLGHAGKLGKLAQTREVEWTLLFCLRLAALFVPPSCGCRPAGHYASRRRTAGTRCACRTTWVANNPLTDYSLIQEAAEWEKIGTPYRVVYTDD